MASIANLVHETSIGTGTGNLTLVNVNGKQSFSGAFSTGGTNVFHYFISNRSAAEWERGTGHMSDATTLVRDTVLESTNSNAAVNFSAGTKDVSNDIPAGLQTDPGILQNYLTGLTLSNNSTDATNDIDIAAGVATDSANSAFIKLASGITKRLDAAWAVGSGNGGLDTGSVANTTYYVWLIRRSDTGVVDALFSTSSSSPTMPANYDQKRRIGAIIRASNAILGFLQYGDEFVLKSAVVDVDVTTQSTSEVAYSISVPAVPVVAHLVISAFTSAAPTAVYIHDPNVVGQNPGAGPSTAGFTGNVGVLATNSATSTAAQSEIWVTTSTGLVEVDAAAAIGRFKITTIGWKDRRGRDG